jgi:hypothetical protein
VVFRCGYIADSFGVSSEIKLKAVESSRKRSVVDGSAFYQRRKGEKV